MPLGRCSTRRNSHDPGRLRPCIGPVGTGFVQSYARPGGNATGFAYGGMDLASKWLQLPQGSGARNYSGRPPVQS